MASAPSAPGKLYKLDRATVVGICIASAVYFADILLRASQKKFWFDELFTVYLCRLPDFKTTWAAVVHGADFNPPLLYLLTRGAEHVFGEGLIGTRLPAMIGVWLLCLSIFLFVFRRNGPVAGFVAASFPLFTEVHYYAYEARAHGIVLGWCGLALLCWQNAKEGGRRGLWVTGFALSVAGALMTHVYAVYMLIPFFLVEVYYVVTERRVDWGLTAAMALPAGMASLIYLPLLKEYRSTIPKTFFEASRFAIPAFYKDMLGPASAVLILLLIVFALNSLKRTGTRCPAPILRSGELLLAVAFVLLPFFGFLGAKLTQGPFIGRYYLASVIGFAVLLGFAVARFPLRPSQLICAACIFVFLVGDIGITWRHRLLHVSDLLIEPSTGLVLNTDGKSPMQRYSALLGVANSSDVLVLSNLEYIYLFRYAPAPLRDHLYFAAPSGDINLGGYRRLEKWAHPGFRLTALSPFLETHNHLVIYATGRGSLSISSFLEAGYDLKSVREDLQGTLYEYEKK